MDKYLTVTAITRYLKSRFDMDENLNKVYLKGEISNLKIHTTGHIYFSIKDENSKINAIMFKSNASKLTFQPKEGMKIMVTGSVTIYEATGNYQIYVNTMQEDGLGNLYVKYQELKEKLSKEGLFDSKYKKEIPKYPKKIGIVTAKTGAAIRDIISTIKRRYPMCETYLFPCLVQGDNAAIDIKNKIDQASTYDLDVMIVGRGGGSFEDLNAFNDEEVARAIFNSNIPIISAVGHEIDFTIADFVADLRAPTPTGAAEMAVPNIYDIKTKLNQLKIRTNEAIYKKVNYLKLYLDTFKNSFMIKNPKLMFDNRKQKLDAIAEKYNTIIFNKIDKFKNYLDKFKTNYIINNPDVLYKKHRTDLEKLTEKIILVNPLNILKKGYSLVYMDDKVIKSTQNIQIKDKLKIKMYDGNIDVYVDNKEVNNDKN